MTPQLSRKLALRAAQTIDALGIALVQHDHYWEQSLRQQYETTRRDLLKILGLTSAADVADLAALS
jgi:hypothetical protein